MQGDGEVAVAVLFIIRETTKEDRRIIALFSPLTLILGYSRIQRRVLLAGLPSDFYIEELCKLKRVRCTGENRAAHAASVYAEAPEPVCKTGGQYLL